MHKVAEQNELVLLNDLEEIVTPGAAELLAVAEQQNETERSSLTSLAHSYIPSFRIPRPVAGMVSVSVFFYNFVTVNGQSCSDGVAIAASSFTGPCLMNVTSVNGLPAAFNIAIKVTSGSSYLYDKIAHLFGIWPISAQPGVCGVLIKSVCEYAPSLAGIPTWQLASWTAAEQTSITIVGMGTLANCTDAAGGYFRNLLTCFYSSTTDFLAHLPTPPATNTLDPNSPTDSAQPAKNGFPPYFIMGLCMLGITALMCAILGALAYRKCTRRPPVQPLDAEAAEPLASASEEDKSADKGEGVAENMGRFSKTAKAAAKQKDAVVGGKLPEHDHDKMFEL